jgi:hypothetical protein
MYLDYSNDGGTNFVNNTFNSYSQAALTHHTISFFTIRNRVNTNGRIRIRAYQLSGATNTLTANLTVQKLGDLYDY